MKKYTKIFFIFLLTILTGCSIVKQMNEQKVKKLENMFNIKDCVVYDKKNQPIAKYQAKTFSLDNGELVDEYNLLYIGKIDKNKEQIIGDLIDFISHRHQGAEVEIEINSEDSPFKL